MIDKKNEQQNYYIDEKTGVLVLINPIKFEKPSVQK